MPRHKSNACHPYLVGVGDDIRLRAVSFRLFWIYLLSSAAVRRSFFDAAYGPFRPAEARRLYR